MKKKEAEEKKEKFPYAPLIFLAVLGVALFIGYKTAKTKISFILSNPIDLGSVLIIPQNYESNFPFEFKWESVKIKIDSTDLFFKNPKISLYPMLGDKRELLTVSIDSIYANIIPPDSSIDNKDSLPEHLSHPDIWLPFRVSINAGKAAVDVKNIGNWSLDSLVAVKSGREKRFYIRAKNISGTHLVKNLFLDADYRWNELFSDASVSLSDRKSDSLNVILNAPRTRLEDLSAEISANVANLPLWLKDKWHSDAPSIEKIVLHSNASINILTNKADFNLSLQTRIGKVWQLPAFNVNISAFGNHNGVSKAEISMNGNNGESIKFRGNVDKNLDGSGELEVNGISVTLGPETLPADVKFHRITKDGNSVSANFTTGAGSNFNAKMADLNNPVIIFSADIAPKEPWAVQWTGDMVKLANPTILTGSFSFKEILLKANLKTGVPYAYYAAADELDVSLWLNSEGIHFPEGKIKRNGYASDFTGEVMWDKEYFKFKLNQQSGGIAEIYGTFNPKIDLSLQNLNTYELPFADTNMLMGYNGIVSGNWQQDFEKRIGEASVSLFTTIKDYTVSAKSDAEMIGDSLIVKNFELEQNEKKVKGSLYALLPSQTGKDFEIQQADINIPNIDLVSLLSVFKDSTLSSGFVDGNLKYNKSVGLAGKLLFSKIALQNLDSKIASFPNLSLEAFGRSAKLSTHLSLSEGFWKGNLEANIAQIGQKSDLPISFFYTANNIDNVGYLKFEGILNKDIKKISGNLQVLGDWFLPGGVGEIKKTNISISAKSVLGKDILDSLTANFNSGRNIYEMGILKIPFEFSGHIGRGMLFVDSAFVYGQSDEKITAKLQFDLNSANIKDLSFNTEQFTLSLLDEHWIKIKNGSGKTKLDSAGIAIIAELPSISYRMESTEYGTAIANLKGQATYRFPFQTGQSQTNPSITGNFEISKTSYKKMLDIMPDPLHLDRTLKSISRFFTSMTRDKRLNATEKQAMTSRPTTLNLKIQTSGMETATVSSNLAEFAFVVNLSVLGTTRNILLSGDANAVGSGKIGYNGLTMFDLSRLRIYWQDVPIMQGIIELSASNDYPRCFKEGNANDEDCTIFVNVTGPLAKLNMQPSTSCSNVDASPALIYYSMLLGCISENYETGVTIDYNKLLGKAISYTINRSFGGNVIGDIDFKWQVFNSEDPLGQDTNYVRIPISLSKWVPSLEAIFGYTSDQSIDRRYDNSYEVGLRYSLPIFDSTDMSWNLIDPSLDISTGLVARKYLSPIEGGSQDETRLEKNIGLVYRHKFWNQCILGMGNCKISDTNNGKNNVKNEEKQTN